MQQLTNKYFTATFYTTHGEKLQASSRYCNDAGRGHEGFSPKAGLIRMKVAK